MPYDGNSDWIPKEDVTEFRDEGANGVRSVLEDPNNDFCSIPNTGIVVYDSATYTTTDSIPGMKV